MPETPTKRQRIAYGDNSEQYGDLWLPRSAVGPVPVVVLFHGGFWKPMYKSDLMDDLARDMAGRGLAVWNVEYRRVGVEGGGGGWPTTYKDAAAALSTLGDLPGVDAERVITFGHSAGGHMALWVAMDASRRSRLGIGDVRAPLGAISLAGVLDLVTAANRKLGARAVQALMGGEPSDLEVEYREASLAAALPHGVRQLIIHGTSDGVVPPDISESYAARACFEGDTVDLRLVAGEDHMQVIDPTSSAWRCATQYIEEIFGLGTDAGVRPERA